MQTKYCNLIRQRFPATFKTPPNSLTVYKKKSVPHNALIVSMDVKALYSSILHSDGIKACEFMLKENCFPSMEISNITKIIDLILAHNHFELNVKSYIQTHGTAMGKK